MSHNRAKCAMCEKDDKPTYKRVSRSCLTFGPFRGSFYFNSPPQVTYEYRCASCERKLSKQIVA